jgi:hypothetical protein
MASVASWSMAARESPQQPWNSPFVYTCPRLRAFQGGNMKKTYTTPTVLSNGSVVGETLASGPAISTETPVSKPLAVGTVGFYL